MPSFGILNSSYNNQVNRLNQNPYWGSTGNSNYTLPGLTTNTPTTTPSPFGTRQNRVVNQGLINGNLTPQTPNVANLGNGSILTNTSNLGLDFNKINSFTRNGETFTRVLKDGQATDMFESGNGVRLSQSDIFNQPTFLSDQYSFLDENGNVLGTLNNQSWLSQNLGTIWNGLQTGLGIVGAYNAFQNRQLFEDQLDAQKAFWNRNIANQAKMINNEYDSHARIAAAQEGSYNNGVVGTTSDGVAQEYMNRAKQKHVDGSPIG